MTRRLGAALLVAGLALVGPSLEARAQQRVVRGTTHTSVHQSIDVGQEVNGNRDIDVDVDRDYHPITTAAAMSTAAAAGAAVVGTVVHTLPQACTEVRVADVAYQQCGTTWYLPQYSGTQLTYVVVAPPR